MPTTDELGFEIERRIIVFHRDTTMPDNTQLGYVGNPNSCVNGNTPGETLLYNAPSGTRYLDKSADPHEEWVKFQDGAGGTWFQTDGGGSTVSGGYFETFSGLRKIMKARYLNYAEKLSNLVGLPILASATLKKVMVVTESVCTGEVHIKVNGTTVYTVTMTSQASKLITGISQALSAGDSVSVYVESTAGMAYPSVRLYIE